MILGDHISSPLSFSALLQNSLGFAGQQKHVAFQWLSVEAPSSPRLPFGERDGKILASAGRLQTTQQGRKLGMWQRTKPSGGPVRATQQEQPSQNGYFGYNGYIFLNTADGPTFLGWKNKLLLVKELFPSSTLPFRSFKG